jgi:hypothetical protein
MIYGDGALSSSFRPHEDPKLGLLISARKAFVCVGTGIEIWERDGTVYTYQTTVAWAAIPWPTGLNGLPIPVTQVISIEGDRDMISASDFAPALH